jgi:GT2 family glycosyltransferase
MSRKTTIIIPVYNNADLLARTLSANIPYFGTNPVVIVDDASTEDISAALRDANFKGEYLRNTVNMGFGATVNKAALQVKTQYLFFLNSDVILLDNSFLSLEKWLEEDPSVFAVSVKQREKDGSLAGKKRIFFDKGMIRNAHARDLDSGLTAWAEAGSCLVRTSYFQDLRGFSPLYAPFYHEDIDLSYRAYKRGWKVLFDPDVLVEHHHESTIGKYYSKKQVARIALRNHLLFMWGNVTDTALLRSHLLSLPQLLWSAFRTDPSLLISYYDAILRYPLVKRHREGERTHIHCTDSEVLSLFK